MSHFWRQFSRKFMQWHQFEIYCNFFAERQCKALFHHFSFSSSSLYFFVLFLDWYFELKIGTLNHKKLGYQQVYLQSYNSIICILVCHHRSRNFFQYQFLYKIVSNSFLLIQSRPSQSFLADFCTSASSKKTTFFTLKKADSQALISLKV